MDECYESSSLSLFSVVSLSFLVSERWEGKSRYESGFLDEGCMEIVLSEAAEYFYVCVFLMLVVVSCEMCSLSVEWDGLCEKTENVRSLV